MHAHESRTIKTLAQFAKHNGDQMSRIPREHGDVVIIGLQSFNVAKGTGSDRAALANVQVLQRPARVRGAANERVGEPTAVVGGTGLHANPRRGRAPETAKRSCCGRKRKKAAPLRPNNFDVAMIRL